MISIEASVAELVSALIAPLRAIETPADLDRLLAALDWDVSGLGDPSSTRLFQGFADAKRAFDELGAALEGELSLIELGEALAHTGGAFSDVVTAVNAASSADIMSRLSSDLLNYLLERCLGSEAPAWFTAFQILQIAKLEISPELKDGATVYRSSRARYVFDVAAVSALIQNPRGYFRKHLGIVTDGSPSSGEALLDVIADIVIPAVARSLTSSYQVPLGTSSEAGQALVLDLRGATADELTRLRAVAGADRTPDAPVGLILAVDGSLDYTAAVAGGALMLTMGGTINPLFLRSSGISAATDQPVSARLTVSYGLDGSGGGPALSLGSAHSAHVAVDRVRLKSEIDLNVGSEAILPDLIVDLDLSKLTIGAGVAGNSFLESLVPGGVGGATDLAIRWSYRRGLTLGSGGGLEFRTPQVLKVGPARLDATFGRVLATEAGVELVAGVDLRAAIGPIELVVQGLGIRGALTAPAHGGNLGPLQLALDVELPNGVGVGVAAGAVSGAGYMKFDVEDGSYSGSLDLKLLDAISVTAVGVVTTRAADGAAEWSMVVVISTHFPGLQLGFGFALTGVGGLLAVHRTLNVPALQAVIKASGLNALLFPPDLMHNASRVVNDLERFFPSAPGQFVIGPTLELTWGEGGILTAQLGIFIEFPSPLRVLVVGRLHLALPVPKTAVVDVRLDVLGVIDFTKKTLAIDAVLRNSRVGPFALTGQAAVRATWGDTPAFVLAIGGFNPRFHPPDNFPSLDRVALTLSKSKNPSVRLSAYVALTSNTAQIGAHLDLAAALDVPVVGKFGIVATLGFDALFQFSPFSFVVDITAAVALTWNGKPFLGVRLDLSLSGPRPWHAVGTATFQIMGKHTLHFELTMGDRPAPEQPVVIDLAEMVRTELAKPSSWSAELAPAPLVTLRSAPEKGQLVVHPMGGLTVKQPVAPLQIRLTRFGQHMLAQPVTLGLPATSLAGVTSSTAVVDHFARAQFVEMSDADKLSQPSFDDLTAGVRVGQFAPQVPGAATWQHRDVDVDLVVLVSSAATAGGGTSLRAGTPSAEAVDVGPASLSEARVLASVASGAVARRGSLSRGAAAYAAPQIGVHVVGPTYSVAERSTMSAVAAPDGKPLAFIPAYTTADEARRADAVGNTRLQVVDTGDVFAPSATRIDGQLTAPAIYRLVAKHSGKCLTVAADRLDEGAPIEQWDWSDSANQHWIISSSEPGVYVITAEHSGLALDVTAAATANGTPIQQWRPTGGPSQQWRLIAIGAGYFKVESVNTGRCLDVAGGSTTTSAGARAEQWDWYAGDNQKWQFVPVVWRSSLREQIRNRAYQLWAARDRAPGHALDDWLTAQRQLIQPTIAARAYAIYQRRGRAPGHALDDWVQAERTVLAEMAANQP
jgi:Family of unknown function (DUF6603)/Ricin-type beta-trefoil lectin domain-like/Protein of unknown function (DUF2934)